MVSACRNLPPPFLPRSFSQEVLLLMGMRAFSALQRGHPRLYEARG